MSTTKTRSCTCTMYTSKQLKISKKNPKVRVAAAKWFQRMENGDKAALNTCRSWRETILKKYKEVYEQLNVKFDVYTGESDVSKESMDAALAQLERMGLLAHRKGARAVDLSKWNLKAPIVRKTGARYTLLSPTPTFANSCCRSRRYFYILNP